VLTDELTLAAEFPTPTREDWLALVDTVLKGGDFHKKLVTRTADGLEIQPLYTASPGDDPDVAGLPGFDPFTRGAHAEPRPSGAWDVRVAVQHPDVAMANAIALDELLRGATSLTIHLRDGGTVMSSADDLDRLLEGVYLDLLPVSLETGGRFLEPARWLREVWSRRGVGGAEVSGSLGIDPLGALARDGVVHDVATALVEVGEQALLTATETPRVRAAAIDCGPYAEAGATPAQQLGALLASGAAYLRAMEAAGLDVSRAAAQIEARLVVDSDFFGAIALCRAARRAWAALLAECGAPEDGRGLHLQVRTAARVMTERDPWVNLLRVASGTFGAALGGADGIVALPFDGELGLPDDLGRRLARNTHLLLQEETHVGRVLDPSGGSWYVETLTEELATAAWALFAGIESDGGMAAVLLDGSFAAKLDGAWAVRRAAIASRKVPVTGVSEFPLLTEAPVRREARPAAVPYGDSALPARHDATDFERLRDAADAHRAATGAWPQVFLANLGPIAVHTARATWARNFFESGGIEALGADGFDDADAAAAAFSASGATVACLCSSDTTYAELAEGTAKALRAAGAARVYLAGNPGDARAAYQSAGVDEFVHVGVDVIESLTRAHHTIGVTR
jgi:methylmalonyl-CoA mutase